MYSFLQATNKPLCNRWLLLMKSAFEGGRKKMKYKNLAEMGTKYTKMIKLYIENICWYQAKLFVMSADLYSQYGEDFLVEAINELKLTEKLLVNNLSKRLKNFQKWLQNWK
jgi:hypothetical protein